MKDSGVEWIGVVPCDWQVIPLKYKVDLNRDTISEMTDSEYKFNYVEIGDVTLEGGINNFTSIEFGNAPSRARRIARKGDIIISTVRTYLKAIAIVGEDYIVSTGFAVLTPHDIDFRYLGYFLKSEYFVQLVSSNSVGISYPAINASKLVEFKILSPSYFEQKRIADFLDFKVKAIDKAIMETKSVIEDYKKYRQSVIVKTVTKGLSDGIPMKSTDCEWIGDIPKHWDYVRIGNLFQTVDERNDDPDAQLLSLYTALGVKPRSELEERGNKAVTVQNYKIVHKNDIIVNKLLAWMGAIGYSDYEGVTSPDYDVYRAKEGANVVRSFYNNYFRYTCFNGDCFKYGHGIMLMRWRTYPEEFLRIKVPNPPYEEQLEIADYLDKKIPEIDKLISEKEELIKDLESYKKSLIYEYVTGKKEVPVEKVR